MSKLSATATKNVQFRSTKNRKLKSGRTAKMQAIFQFYDDLSHIKRITNKNLFSELPFQKRFVKEQIITKYLSAFKNNASSYTIKVLNYRDPAIQLNITNPHVKNKRKDLLAEMKGFKFQINL